VGAPPGSALRGRAGGAFGDRTLLQRGIGAPAGRVLHHRRRPWDRARHRPGRVPRGAPMSGREFVLITGASGGIGAAVAHAAAAEGWGLVLGYGRGRAAAERLAEALRAGGAEAVTAALPLHDPEAMRQGLERLPALDLAAAVLSAAPVPPVQPFLKHRDADFREQLLPTVAGNHRLLAELWKRHFRRRGGGHLVAILSAALREPPVPHLAAYVVAKA